MVFYVSGTSVQLPVRAESAAANAVCGFRPSQMDGRGAFAVRRAAGEEDHRSGTARNAPGASGTLHPSNCPGGEHGLRLQAVLNGRMRSLSVSRSAGKVRDTRDGVLRLRHIRPVARAGGIHGGERGLRLQTVSGGRTRSFFRASRSRGRGSSQWNCPERAEREWYAASVQLPGRRARFALQAVIGGRTRSLCCASRSRERESSQWNRPERAGRGWYVKRCAASVQLPGRRARFALQAVLNGRTRSLSVSRAAGKVRDTRDGVLRLRHIRPVARTGGIRGGERGLRLQTVVNGRTRSLCRASRSRERESSQWNRPERAGREWYAASVQLPGRRARFVLQAVIGGRTRSLIVRRAAGKENRRSGTARSAPGASGTLHPSNCPGGEHGLRFRPSLVDGRGALSCVA